MSYDINATSLRNCPFVNGGQFCAMQVGANNANALHVLIADTCSTWLTSSSAAAAAAA
jgi:hypothetical protein